MRLAVYLGLCFACTAALRAQSTPPDRRARGGREPDSARSSAADTAAHRLGRVSITAARTQQKGYTASATTSAMKTTTPLLDTPQSVSVVTRALIADQAMQSMADVVRYVPGVTMGQGEGNRDQPTIRGNSSTADFFVDGVRDDAQYFRDVYNVERVEALKGPNAMVFGRGGGGGVINRVTKEAQWLPLRTLTLEGGRYDHRRSTLDVGQPLTDATAARLNAVYERSDTFRDGVGIRRYGLNPTIALVLGARTIARLGYEYFDDHRTADRGIPSFLGAPSNAPIATFFGDPGASYADARVHGAAAIIEHTANELTLRNRTRVTHYDKFYQNVYPAGAVDSAGAQVNLAAYNNSHTRDNLFNQTDLTWTYRTGSVRHTLLAGTEIGRQATDNFRNTGYFGDSTTSVGVPFARPTVAADVTFRQSATDADNRVVAQVAAAYVQDQLTLSERWQAVLGVRYDAFGLTYRDHRTDRRLERDDRLVSPRAGLVFKPAANLSVYGAYGVSHLPSAGDQFSSLTATSQTLEPERFTNYEAGAKWEAARGLALSAAAYRLDRTNTSARDPNDASRIVQTGSQRTTGVELGVTGAITPAWQVAGGVASQNARITNATTAAKAGATVSLVPHVAASLWNSYRLRPALGLALGVIHQTRMFSAVDNRVVLPGFTRADAAAFVTLHRFLRTQLNVENLFDRRYFGTSNGNNNIMPGAPRTIRVSLTTDF